MNGFRLLIFLFLFCACSPQKTAVKQPRLNFKIENSQRSFLHAVNEKKQPLVDFKNHKFSPDELLPKIPGGLARLQKINDLQNSELKSKATEIRKTLLLMGLFSSLKKLISQELNEMFLLGLAKGKKLSIPEYVESEILKGQQALAEPQFVQYLKSKGMAIETLNEENRKILFESAKMVFHQQQIDRHLDQLNLHAEIRWHFQPPKIDFSDEGEWKLVLGSLQQKNSVLFFGNFRCPECAQVLSFLAEEMGKSDSFNIQFRFVDPNLDPFRRMMAETAYCLSEQGVQKFFDFYYHFAESVEPFIEAEMMKVAEATGADLATLKACRYQGKYSEVVQYHLEYSQYLGINSLPIVIVEDQIFEGAGDMKALQARLPVSQPLSFWARSWLWLKNLF